MVFRIHSSGPIDLKDWGSRQRKLDENAISTITDTLTEGNPSKVATSIPDPFARMYLFETAFQIKKNDRFGNSLYHMLISDCLDVFHLLFLVGDSPDIEFKQWNKTKELKELKSKPPIQTGGKVRSHPHVLLGESFELAMSSSRFKDFDEIFLIFYKKILLGGTSPLTLFFTSPNFQRQMRESGNSFPSSTSNDVFFDQVPASLSERAEDFQEFMFRYFTVYSQELSLRCPHFADYIMKCGENDNPRLYNKIKQQQYGLTELNSNYCKIKLDQNTGKTLKSGVFDIFLYKQEDVQTMIYTNSGFVMETSVDYYKRYNDSKGQVVEINTPLALVSTMNPSIKYIYNIWDPNTPVEYLSYKALHERELPGNSKIKYPYVTTGDFLEDKLIKMPFNINNEFFYSGFNGKFEFLLPIKKNYFNFYTLEDLQRNLSITNDVEKVFVRLKIPIRNGNSIEFTKEYKKNDPDQVYNPDHDTRGIGMGIFPFYQVTDKRSLNDYAVMLIDNSEKPIDLQFYRYDQVINDNPLKYDKFVRNAKTIQAGSNYYRINKNADNSFDLIEINCGEYRGLVIPAFKKVEIDSNPHHFRFAIDFGTSNTHIAFNTDRDLNIQPFNIGIKDLQMVLLNERSQSTNVKNLGETFNYGAGQLSEILLYKHTEFVPSVIGPESDVKFPMRTSTCESKDFASKSMELFGNVNIGFSLDSEERERDNTAFATNIKWGMELNPDGQAEQNRIKAFFEQIAWMIKNKIIMNGGKPDPDICWFVPMSMKMPIQSSFKDSWDSALRNHFGDNHQCRLQKQSEAVVPYYFLRNIHSFFKSSDAVNIDIGGGTIDIIFYVNSQNRSFSTSFKYGANTIWGDGITRQKGSASQKDNGFYLLMKDKIDKGLTLDNRVRNYYSTISKYSLFDSADLISFLFKYDSEFKFTNSIKVHRYLSSLLFLHLGSVIYHISDIIKERKLEIPTYMTFSGKGSEYLNIILPDNVELTKFCGMLFEKFTGKSKPKLFEVILANNPKEVTANGGISMLNSDDHLDPLNIISTGVEGKHAFGDNKSDEPLYIKDLKGLKPGLIDNLKRFVKILTTDKDLQAFFKNYNITFQYGQESLQERVALFAEHSFDQLRQEAELKSNPNDLVDETPFFWCLKDTFYRLSKELYKL